MMRVLNSGQLNTVQDLGRTGYRDIGVGTAGVMDRLALVLGNRLVGNPPNSAGVELTLPPFRIRFTRNTLFALAGADFNATLDGVPIASWSATMALAGQRLDLSSSPKAGARAYLCVQGGVNVPQVLGSSSTDLKGVFGGLQGRSLQKGDRLHQRPGEYSELRIPVGASASLSPPPYGLSSGLISFERNSCIPVRVLPAIEHEWLNHESREAFWNAEWKVTSESNRMGYRLAGPILDFTEGQRRELLSHGILSGVIQLPPSRQPIVQLHDCNTIGGYPKIGCVIAADLRVLAQVPLGSHVRFIKVDYEEAVLALKCEQQLTKELCTNADTVMQRLAKSI